MYVYMQRLLHQSLQLPTSPPSLKVRHHHAVCPFIPWLPLLLIVVCIQWILWLLLQPPQLIFQVTSPPQLQVRQYLLSLNIIIIHAFNVHVYTEIATIITPVTSKSNIPSFAESETPLCCLPFHSIVLLYTYSGYYGYCISHPNWFSQYITSPSQLQVSDDKYLLSYYIAGLILSALIMITVYVFNVYAETGEVSVLLMPTVSPTIINDLSIVVRV